MGVLRRVPAGNSYEVGVAVRRRGASGDGLGDEVAVGADRGAAAGSGSGEVAAPSSEIEELRALAERAHGDEPGAPAGSEAAAVDLVRLGGESVRALASELAASGNFGRGLLEAMTDQLRSWPRTPDGRLLTGDYGAREIVDVAREMLEARLRTVAMMAA